MSREGLTEIVCILDKSGSMASVKNDAIGGFNTFIKDQKNVAGEATLSLIMFAAGYSIIYEGKNIKDAPDLDDKTFIPGGSTALLDAIGKTINAVGVRLSNISEQDRPSKVIFVILTDGEENSSREFTKAKINEMITHQKDTYNWAFIYLAANQDVFSEAGKIGIGAGQTMCYNSTSQGTRNVYNSMSSTVSNFRQTGDSEVKP